jgi:hippurate hydrolase
VVTVGSFHAGTTHNIIPDEAKLQITVRSYTPEVRQSLLDGIRRIARGEAIAAGLPDDRMPLVSVRDPSTPATVNSEDLTAEAKTLFTRLFGAERVRNVPAAMVGEDFSRYLIANPSGRSLLFWVGGVPQARWDEVKGETTNLPGLHSPMWAPDAEKVIGTAVVAMEAAALQALGG